MAPTPPRDKKEIVIEVAGAVPSAKPYVVKSFPLPVSPEAHYDVPLYYVNVYLADDHLSKATYRAKEEFKALRFGVYSNDGSDKHYKATGKFVVGLSDDKWYRCLEYKAYKLHSNTENPDNGAWVIENLHYIHSGPQGYNDSGYGTAGCVEIFGAGEFVRFCKTLVQYSGSHSRNQVTGAVPVWIHVSGVARPAITPHK
jgi:hypothetical protein